MARSRDDFSAGVRDVLAHRAGFRCSKPDCRAPTAGPAEADDKRGSIGIAANITAAARGGPRFDESLTSEVRGSAINGFWLCDNHTREIDTDDNRFSVEVLRAWKHHAEDEARAMLGRPISSSGLNAAIELSLQRDVNDGLHIMGETNLPDGTKLMATLLEPGTPRYHAQTKCVVHSRRLLLGPFSSSAKALPQDWYQVQICSYFNGPWKQPAHVLEMTGQGGAKLLGAFANPVDPDLDDTEYSIERCVECLAPPMNSEPPLSDDEVQSAIKILQRSVLHVEGQEPLASSAPVIDVVEWFMCNAGLTARDGWLARVRTRGLVEVGYSFWDGPNPAEALWHIIPRSRGVRYRNRYAKYMS